MKTKLFLFAAMLCAAMTAAANDAKISGRIKDANDNSAVIGATVLLMQDTVQAAGTPMDANGVRPVGRAEAQVARPFSEAVWTIAHLLPNAMTKIHLENAKNKKIPVELRFRRGDCAIFGRRLSAGKHYLSS